MPRTALRVFDRQTSWPQAVGVGLVVAFVTGLAAGPVAAGLVVTYLSWALLAVRRARSNQRQAQRHKDTKHAVSLASADLNAGTPCGTVLTGLSAVLAGDDSFHGRATRERVNVIRAIAERTGAPAARLTQLLGEELRAQMRGRAAVSAHTAGCRASARLLAALPVAGIALGEGIGAQPLEFLLHTQLGAACAAAAVALQGIGLMWSRRIETRACDEWGWSG